MDFIAKEVTVYAHEKLAVELQRAGMSLEDAVEAIGVSRPSLVSWITEGKGAQKAKKELIEKVLPKMRVGDWRKVHEMTLNSGELLNVWRIRKSKSIKQVANLLNNTSNRHIFNIFSGLKYIDEETKKTILKITKELWS